MAHNRPRWESWAPKTWSPLCQWEINFLLAPPPLTLSPWWYLSRDIPDTERERQRRICLANASVTCLSRAKLSNAEVFSDVTNTWWLTVRAKIILEMLTRSGLEILVILLTLECSMVELVHSKADSYVERKRNNCNNILFSDLFVSSLHILF